MRQAIKKLKRISLYVRQTGGEQRADFMERRSKILAGAFPVPRCRDCGKRVSHGRVKCFACDHLPILDKLSQEEVV